MVALLDNACHQSSDPPDHQSLTVTHRVWTGKRRQPKIVIDEAFLAEALRLRGPTHIAPILQCSPRSIKHRGLEAGLLMLGAPVITTAAQGNGGVARVYTSSTHPVSTLSDDALDALLVDLLNIFPDFGRRMITGWLAAASHLVPRTCITASYLRVHRPPAVFGDRAIHRKVYSVPGANSLWHHDGQHGLIRFKMVQHCFVDGKSRLVTSIQVRDNNRAQTVLDLFLHIVNVYGWLSRVQGDHGTENVLVAQAMETERGVERGSYIWGRSIHNTRIERLWYDVTHGYGQKWKNFFIELETHYGLNPTNSAHIWLLHHLFLRSVNQDAQEWAEAWNSHKVQIAGQRACSPRDIFFFSMVQDGPHGMDRRQNGPLVEDADDIDPATYGINWEVGHNPHLMNHLLKNNPQDWADSNSFNSGSASLSHVPCNPLNCPLSPEQVENLDSEVARHVDTSSRNMVVR